MRHGATCIQCAPPAWTTVQTPPPTHWLPATAPISKPAFVRVPATCLQSPEPRGAGSGTESSDGSDDDDASFADLRPRGVSIDATRNGGYPERAPGGPRRRFTADDGRGAPGGRAAPPRPGAPVPPQPAGSDAAGAGSTAAEAPTGLLGRTKNLLASLGMGRGKGGKAKAKGKVRQWR